MEPEEGKLSVWVCREEKLVSGVSKRTTCADVVKVLLEDVRGAQDGASASMLSGAPQSYCVVEKWRGFERILPNKTRILRLWGAWGDEQENVRFVLVKNEASLPNNGPRSAEARVVQSKDSSGSPQRSAATYPSLIPGKGCWTAAVAAATAGANLSQQDKQRRIVRKAFRKLDKMNKKREETSVSKDKGSMEKMETLVHLVISQDHTIRQQVQRVRELDKEIERYEAKVHYDRIKRHGVNYVQDTYMVEGSTTEVQPFADCKRKAGRPGATAEALAHFEEYARRCEEMVRLEEELAEREALVESITGQLQEELNQRWMKRRREESVGRDAESSLGNSGDITRSPAAVAAPCRAAAGAADASENDRASEEERIKTQLDTSLYIGLRLNTDLEAMKGDLELSVDAWAAKEKELLDLLARVETLEEVELSGGGEDSGNVGSAPAVVVEVEVEAQVSSSSPPAMEKSGGGGWGAPERGLSNTGHGNDDDSDTGLSSMHSQDSDNPPVCESLV